MDEKSVDGVRRMAYINGEKALPAWLIKEIRRYVREGIIYIPPSPNTRRAWGSQSGARQMLEERNREIRSRKSQGESIAALARAYCLSEETIRKIIY